MSLYEASAKRSSIGATWLEGKTIRKLRRGACARVGEGHQLAGALQGFAMAKELLGRLERREILI